MTDVESDGNTGGRQPSIIRGVTPNQNEGNPLRNGRG